MSFQQPSSDDGRARVDSLYGESSNDTREASDERTLYGEPCHETGSEYDEQTLYGKPQHETRDDERELPDLELLFARMRAESAAGPAVLPPRAESTSAETTEL
ncbi:hypothetical protein [Halorussus lipolyticus]|uniref:hypothetical protein n=1 Tax=Halorussus lipolyticus TaxID=3034024 RepID=UPI0023E8DAC6|nr:hypothetical protein [Halorussus sp. DT80]